MYVEPIKDRAKIAEVGNYLAKNRNAKYAMLWKFGCNTILRISDLLAFRVCDVMNGDGVRDKLGLREIKTGKVRIIYFNEPLRRDLQVYIINNGLKAFDYLFYHSPRHKNRPLSRKSAWREIKAACKAVGITANVGTHTMRKSLAWAIYSSDKDLGLTMTMLNHSSVKSTLSYLGITNAQIEKAYMQTCL